MSNTAILTQILALQEHCKGYLKPDDYIEALSLFLALGAASPTTLTQIAALRDQPEECQTYFFAQLEYLKGIEPDKPWEAGCLAGVPGPVMGMLAYVINKQAEFIPQYAEAARHYYVKNFHRRSRPELILQKYLQVLIGNVQGKALLDSHCGLALKTELFNPALLVLNEADPTLSRISHRLLIAQGIDVIFCKQDYLIAACTSESQKPSNDEALLKANALQQTELFDIAIVEPPTRPLLQNDQLDILAAKFPFLSTPPAELPSTASTSLWIQQTLRQLNDKGMAYVIVSNGWLSRGGYDAVVRTALINSSNIDSVISLEDSPRSVDSKSILILSKQAKDPKQITFLNESSAINRALDHVAMDDFVGDLFKSPEAAPSDPNCVVVTAEAILAKQDEGDRVANLLAQHYLPSAQQTADNFSTPQDELEELARIEERAKAAQQILNALIKKHQP